MGLRFHRSFRVMPGVRLNVSKRGFGLSIGNRWAGFSVGPAGTRIRAAVPGSGLSWSRGIGGGRRSAAAAAVAAGAAAGAVAGRRSRREPPPPLPAAFDPGFAEDGTLVLLGPDGQPFAADVQQALRKAHKATLEPWVEQTVEAWNDAIDETVSVHDETPPPDAQLVYTPRPFEAPAPLVPSPPKSGCLALVWPPLRAAANAERQRLLDAHSLEQQRWTTEKSAHETIEERRRWLYDVGRRHTADAMEETLEHVLAGIPWPYETLLSAEVTSDRRAVWIDVDLPEIDAVPGFRWKTRRGGLDVERRDVSDTQVRKEYALHVHGVVFRVVGEAFAALPDVQEVVASGYSTRLDKATGHARDEYLLSVRVDRAGWGRIRFEALEQVDPIEALAVFDLRRRMTVTGIFTGIEPFAPADGIAGP
jgi:hypothetical protein